MPYKDPKVRKKKHAEYSATYYSKNKDKHKALSKAYRAMAKEKWVVFKNTLSCTQCGFSHSAALDFHHTDPDKKENIISKLVSEGRFSAAMEELQKCIVLCANCHRVHHYKEKKNPAS
jgi:heterodisulfide reductase subunit B